MAFADVIRKQRKGGSGVFKSLSSAAAESMKEKMDPRNLLNQKGVLTALFPGLRSYSTRKTEQASSKISSGPTLVSMNNESLNAMNEKLDFIGKNTMSLPIMMRDINVMRQSLIKLVKLQGGTQEDKADKFFKTAAEQEKLYENTLKNKRSSTSPTKITPNKGGGMLENLALLGAVFATVLGGYFASPEFKEKVDKAIGGFIKSVFGENLFSNLITGVTAAVAALAILKGSFIAFDVFTRALMGKLAAKVGLPVPGTQQTIPDAPDMDKDGKSKGKGKPKYGTIQDRPKTTMDKAREAASKARGAINATNIARLGAVGLLVGEAYAMYKLIESDSHETLSQADVEQGEIGGWSPEQGFTAEGGPVNTDNIKGLSELPKNFQDPSNATAESKRLNNYKPTPLKNDGVSMLERIMDSEGITDPDLRARIIALAKVESGLNPNAKGPMIRSEKSMHFGDQAHGLLQIMPKTAEEMGFSRSDIQDPEKAALAGVRYFMKNYNRFQSLDAATVAHHSGPGGAKKFLEYGDSGTTDVATGLRTSDYLTKVTGAQVAMSGGTIGARTTSLADARTEMNVMPPVVINNSPQTVNNMGGGSSSVVMASVVDEEFSRLLFERAII